MTGKVSRERKGKGGGAGRCLPDDNVGLPASAMPPYHAATAHAVHHLRCRPRLHAPLPAMLPYFLPGSALAHHHLLGSGWTNLLLVRISLEPFRHSTGSRWTSLLQLRGAVDRLPARSMIPTTRPRLPLYRAPEAFALPIPPAAVRFIVPTTCYGLPFLHAGRLIPAGPIHGMYSMPAPPACCHFLIPATNITRLGWILHH